MIKNYERVLKELTEVLMMFDIEKRGYQRDVYVYIDENGNAVLYVYDNISSNSRIDDEHYVVYRDKPHYDTIYDFYDENGIDTTCEALNVEAYDFTKAVADYVNCDINEVDMNDIKCYVDKNDELFTMLYTYHEQFIREHYPEYEENARYYIDKLDELLDELDEEE